MMKSHKKQHISLIFAFLLLSPLWLWGQNIPEKPSPARFVNDYAQLFSSQENKDLSYKLEQYDKNTSTQIVVITINKLSDYGAGSIDGLANQWARNWGIGQKGADNGLLILISKEDRKVRIEVGYGLEGYIPDLRAAELIEWHLVPQFKQGKFYQGVNNLVHAIGELAEGGFTEEDRYTGESNDGIPASGKAGIIAGIMALLGSGAYWYRKGNRYKRLYGQIKGQLNDPALWAKLKTSYAGEQVDAKRMQLKNEYALLSPNPQSKEAIIKMYELLQEIRRSPDKFFQKRHDADLRKIARKLEEFSSKSIFDVNSCREVQQQLKAELNYFDPLALNPLSGADRNRLQQAEQRFKVIYDSPETLIKLDIEGLKREISKVLNDNSFWQSYESQYTSRSIKKCRDQYKDAYNRILSNGLEGQARALALYQFYKESIQRLRSDLPSKLTRKPVRRPSSSARSSGGFISGSGGGSSSSGSSGSDFGGGDFGGGGATGSW